MQNNLEITNDVVNKPAHYTDGKIEVIDFIEDKKLGFHLGNAVKYISRAGKKDPAKMVEDLQKAKWYLEREIKKLEGSQESYQEPKPDLIELHEFGKFLTGLDFDSEIHRKNIGTKAYKLGVISATPLREAYQKSYNILEIKWGDGSETREILRSPK